MGTDRLHLAVLPGLILLSLSSAERCSGSAGWVFTEPQLRARAGDSVLLQCLFLEPAAKGWTMDKVDWLRMAGPGVQKVGWDGGWAVGQGRQPAARGGLWGSPSWKVPLCGGTSTAPRVPTMQGSCGTGCCVLGLSRRAQE